jgi:Dockerin type I domain
VRSPAGGLPGRRPFRPPVGALAAALCMALAASFHGPARAFDGCSAADVVADGVVNWDDLEWIDEGIGAGSHCPRRDLDGSSLVDPADRAILMGFFGRTCTYCSADLDGNGVVDGGDRQLCEADLGLDCRPDLDRNGTVGATDEDLVEAYLGVSTAGTPAARADLDGDGDVDETDRSLVAAAAGRDCGADLDKDGTVTRRDLWLLLAAWGDCPEPPPPASRTWPPDRDDPCDEGSTIPIPPSAP